ncbi:MAG: TolC family protein [Gammaproteobacteria bacterium]|uniref:TolC family protein n=1 Tax=Rhodoferax sp. TaxID=50421 RepID=UPI0017E7CE88|nr:TolC family protein [Rhodoferax sp.]MBU3897643.1 TolC family protein [Gammaproteobacteria bacterium]MBA3058269.1 TolC family protein [Rhodoferax sp.]MBU3999452.1 TolC family protein [Gammaproteobacteria bacterium]MBU4017713.1 TolC family protein [Gammaproteobacteria bacterium]MBU4081156.1 TolC family protein [Gammaproteobacteria bacterium]
MKPLSRLLLFVLLFSTVKAVVAADPLPLWEAMERAVQSNPAIKSQRVEVSRQTLEQDIARSQHLPKVDLSAAYTRYAYPTFVTPIREVGVFPPMDTAIANIGLALNLPLYSGGKLVAGEALAAHNREASVQALRAGGQDLLFNVAATYTKALHFRQLVKVLDVRIQALQQEERDIGLRIQQGRAARLELIRLQTQLSQARYDKVSVTQAEKDALSLLAALLGESGSAPILSNLGATAPVLPVSAEEAIGRALQQRPDILRLDVLGKAAQQKTAIARGDRLPQINLVAKVQESGSGNWNGYNDWQIGVQLSLPLFDGDIRKHRVDQAGLEQQQNALQQEDARNRLVSEVEQAFGALSESRARLEAATQGEGEANEALRIEALRYRSGENTITDLLGAESAHWSATASRLQAGYDITVSQARLLRVIGELGPDSFRPAVADKKSGAEHSSSDIEMHTLAKYLSWHRCGMTCDGESIAQKANVGISPHPQFTTTDHPASSVQQGTRL